MRINTYFMPLVGQNYVEVTAESEVGRAGFLWLNRPIGWAAEFEELTMGNGSPGGDDNGKNEADVHDAESDELSWPSIEATEDDEREAVAAVNLDDDLYAEDYAESDVSEEGRLADQPVSVSAGGSFGSIMGRNSFQRPKPEAIELLHEVMDIHANVA